MQGLLFFLMVVLVTNLWAAPPVEKKDTGIKSTTVGTSTSTVSQEIFAKVNGVPIYHRDLYNRLFRTNGQAVITQMVDEILAEEEIQTRKLKINDKDIDARLSDIKGRFVTQDAFTRELENAGFTLENYKTQIRRELAIEKMIVTEAKVTVSSEEVKTFYTTNKEQLAEPEQIRARHILLATQQEAELVTVALKAGADFAILAREKSLDPATRNQGGDLGFFRKGMLIPEFEQIAFSLKPGEISNPVKSNLGFHIIKVEEKKEHKEALFDETMRKRIETIIYQQKIANARPTFFQTLRAKAKIEQQP